jgi:hypothetical protein
MAWAEDTAGYGWTAQSVAENLWPTMQAEVASWLTKDYDAGAGVATFDGYHDDIEGPQFSAAGDESIRLWINYSNNMSIYCHSLDKNFTTAVCYDWDQKRNQFLYVDAIVTMFYDATSLFENAQASGFWQNNFGTVSSPASPVVIGIMNRDSNTYSFQYQLQKCSEFMETYGYDNLGGFAIWLYEYMGTNADDWSSWKYWIDSLGEGVYPSGYTINLRSNPMTAALDVSGATYETNTSMVMFPATITVTAPTTVYSYTHNSITGKTTTGTSGGYSTWEYTVGPLTVETDTDTSMIYVYSPNSGYARIAVYVGETLATATIVTNTTALTTNASAFNRFNIATMNLFANSSYWISLKGNYNGFMSYGAGSSNTWYKTASYATDFTAIHGAIESGMGGQMTAYFASGVATETAHYFSHWEDDSTSATRTIDVSEDTELTAYYATDEAVPESSPSPSSSVSPVVYPSVGPSETSFVVPSDDVTPSSSTPVGVVDWFSANVVVVGVVVAVAVFVGVTLLLARKH